MRPLVWARLSIACLTACVLADVSLDDRGCPCVDGWVCRDEACVPLAAASDGGNDEGDGAVGSDGGCDKQVQFDPDNCGACGRSCGAAPCQDGVCITTKIAENRSFPTALAVSAKWVTFSQEDPSGYPGPTVAYCPRAGCSAAESAHEILCAPPMPIAVNDEDAFWGKGNGTLSRGAHQPLPDGATLHGYQTVTTDVAKVSALALDGTRLFFAESSANGAVRACDALDLRTCADGGSALIVPGRANLRSLVFERTSRRLFWIDDAGGGAIVSCATDGPCTDPVVVVAAQPHAHALAVDATEVFWTNGEDGTVLRAPATGLAPSALPGIVARDLAMPWGIAVDGDAVYVSTLGAGIAADASTADGTIVRLPRAGGAPLVLARNLARPWTVVVDDALVFWTDRGTQPKEGSVESVVK